MEELTRKINTPICLCLGFFDCLHVVHRKIINSCKDYANKFGYKTAIFTFKDEGIDLFKGQLICTYKERFYLMQELGLDYVLPFVFNEECKNTNRSNFLEQITAIAPVKAIFCGYDYTFGHKGEGNVDFLRDYCKNNQIELFVCECESINGEKISSSMIKRLLSLGDIKKANELLVNRYSIVGKVVKGRGEGKIFGFPTANVSVPSTKALPAFGVYATLTSIDGVIYKSVTNVGAKPTFGINSATIETLIADFNDDIYGKTIKVEFLSFIRTIKRFESANELKIQIYNDLQWENKND